MELLDFILSTTSAGSWTEIVVLVRLLGRTSAPRLVSEGVEQTLEACNLTLELNCRSQGLLYIVEWALFEREAGCVLLSMLHG